MARGLKLLVNQLLQLDDTDSVDEHARVVAPKNYEVADQAPQPLLKFAHGLPHLTATNIAQLGACFA